MLVLTVAYRSCAVGRPRPGVHHRTKAVQLVKDRSPAAERLYKSLSAAEMVNRLEHALEVVGILAFPLTLLHRAARRFISAAKIVVVEGVPAAGRS